MNETPLLSVSALSAGYGAGAAVADVSFSLRAGEILCLVGESGCGKSTLLKALMGTEPGLQRLSGDIALDGRSLLSLPARERRRICADRFGFVDIRLGADVA